jgi:hypothetical protein
MQLNIDNESVLPAIDNISANLPHVPAIVGKNIATAGLLPPLKTFPARSFFYLGAGILFFPDLGPSLYSE